MGRIAEDEKILWKDRKRHLGMPISFTKYTVDDERLYLETGFFKSEVNELLLYRILDIKSTRTLWQKLCGVGTIILYSADQSDRTLELKNVKNPKKVHRFISDTVERERRENGIAGREMIGTAGLDMDHIDGKCDLHEHDENGNGIPDNMEPVSFEDFDNK